MRPGRLPLVVCALAVAACAENPAGVGGPVTGYVFDARVGAIRPMLGIPGAAYLGTSLVSQVENASIAPDGSAALTSHSGRLIVYAELRAAAPVAITIEAGISGADHFAWAPDSGAAAVYASKTGQAQVLTGFAQAPSAGIPFGLSEIAGAVTAFAFDGQRVIFGVTSQESGGIYIGNGQDSAQRIAAAVNPTAIALAGADLYFADGGSQEIREITDYIRTPAAVEFSKNGISSPAGLQVSADGKKLYVANAGSRKVSVYDVASRTEIQSLNLDFTPTRLDRFGSSSAFLLNGIGQGPLYVLTDNAQSPTVYFVPAPRNQPRKIRYRPI